MNTNLKDKNILITGATSGIGRGCINKLSEFSKNTFIVGRDAVRLEEVRSENLLYKENCFLGDLTNDFFLDELIDKLPVLDGLVLSAGIIDYTPAKMLNLKKLNSVFNINFFAIVLLIQKLLKKKKLANKSSIVLISSISSKTAVLGTSTYAASKAALNAYGRVLASELSGRGIRVNMVLPGIVKTKLIENKLLDQEAIEDNEKDYPLGYGEVKDVVNQVIYLLSDLSCWVTGTEIIIDGGVLLKR
ncbi:SDR family NAD(P)-dependent oxidoreductase [Elizabethkingia anophelis]|jgi:NAD(P)-dependent dehydrogenase (short-subunit alcohol dehydrogenase family)|uniref:SDR family NAD(P)-dependent oxidoreductase n=1 Tax=Elizabethkingia anophelis TaxID=1117645 RepID=UPI0021A9538F|nr:SDR family oxidoreductase [Elizabethkingia anophelis]